MEYSHDDNCTCPGCLTWDDYDHVYIDFAMEYSRQMLTYTLAVELLSDFPKNLPRDILIPIIAKRYQVLTAEMKHRGMNTEHEFDSDYTFLRKAASVRLTPKQHRIRCAYEGLYNLARLGKKIPEMEFPQFNRFLVSQNVIVICAFAEGFIANTLRKLCEVRPGPFDRWQRRQHHKLSGLGVSEVLDQFVFEMGYGSFDKKMKHIEKEFDLKIPISKDDREKIGELFMIRNCIVHNASLVSKPYKQNSRTNTHLCVGDEIPLPGDTIEELLDTLVDAIIAIYRSVSLDVLKKPENRLMYGAYRNLSETFFESPEDYAEG